MTVGLSRTKSILRQLRQVFLSNISPYTTLSLILFKCDLLIWERLISSDDRYGDVIKARC